MKSVSKAPTAHRKFVQRFPRLGKAWELASEEASVGPLDEKAQRLVKLAVAIGALREGAVHSSVRKARDVGASLAAMEQVVALAASTIGLPSAVAVWTWVRDEAGRTAAERRPVVRSPSNGCLAAAQSQQHWRTALRAEPRYFR